MIQRIVIKMLLGVGSVVVPAMVEYFWGLFVADTVNGNFTSGVDPLMAGTEDKVERWIGRKRFMFDTQVGQGVLEQRLQDPRVLEMNIKANTWIRDQQALILTYAWRGLGGVAIAVGSTLAGDVDMHFVVGRKG